MCHFFSFVTYNGGKYYFNVGQRLSLDGGLKPDSHTSICHFFKLDEDRCNKYEYVKGQLIIDQINGVNNEEKVKAWINIFKDSDSFRQICLATVKQDGYVLEYVNEPDREICLEAVKQNGHALFYVKEQDREICLEAVKQNGYALRYINEQDKEICLEAVRQNGGALEYVQNQDRDICLAAVEQDGGALVYVQERFRYLFKKGRK